MERRNFLKTMGAMGTAITIPSALSHALATSAPSDQSDASDASDRSDATAAPTASAARKPNVLFILADDMRPDCISALGNPHIKTPNLDKLVARGMTFTRAYVMGSMSGAVCMPSRTMILTGRTMFHLPPPTWKDTRPYATWPKAMSAGGYETFHLGKMGNSFKPGMEAFDACLYTSQIGADKHDVASEKTADRVLEFLRARKSDKPFFIYMAPPVPHDPRIAPKEFMDMYDPEKIPLPPAYMAVHPFDNGEMTVRDEKLAPWPRTPEVIRRHLADDYACITCLDFHIGRILSALKDSGQLDNTIVAFAADNGLSLGEHGLMGKQNLYEFGGMHVPLVIMGPGIPQGKSDAFVYLGEIFPTVCDLTGTAIPPEVEMKSFAPVVMGKAAKIRDTLFTAYGKVQRAIRDDRWKLIRYPLVNKTQLFDLQNDPREMKDLADKLEHADKVKTMMAMLEKAQKDYDDPFPLTGESPKDAAWTPPKEGEANPGNPNKAARQQKKKNAA
ncbi:MAG: sulfatase-like hydrolase/transferase [Candidatus Sumerlaeota bacterium]|nr:sulfatase-like hydrolase/transferase [Candidatus Sumerlaeota bacterium]